MKKYVLWILVAVFFCAVTYGGCGGTGNMASVDSEETLPVDDNTDNSGGREGTNGTQSKIVDISALTEDYTAHDGKILTDELNGKIRLSIADGAVVTLRYADIIGNKSYNWPGITCEGDAAIILEGENYIGGFAKNYPAVYVPKNKTLTITGSGSLVAESRNNAAGIGSGNEDTCGNINIRGGTITARGGQYAAGIGSGSRGGCGNITISGGTITATAKKEGAGIGSGSRGVCGNIEITGGTITARGGQYAAGIGNGREASCGNITITSGVDKVKVTMGGSAPYSIGSSGGTLTIGSTETICISDDPYIYMPVLDLSILTANLTLLDGQTITGTLSRDVKISIADGSAVTLRDMTINGTNNSAYDWAGINCLGDAVLILEGDNSVRGFDQFLPGVHVPVNKTLTIKGNGSLNASSNGRAAGIGGGVDLACGNIIIEDGTITAAGGNHAAGIGSANNYCGDISIRGGNVTATGGKIYGAGIGTGHSGECGNITLSGGTIRASGGSNAPGIGAGGYGRCGNITILDTVTSVLAEKGAYAPYSIGGNDKKPCGIVTIGGVETGYISESPYPYP